MIKREDITIIIIGIVKELGEELEDKELIFANNDTVLFGHQGNIDSITLVRLIADIEDKVYEEYNQIIIIADERAMSQRTSPFLTIASLARYVGKLISN